MKLPGFQSDVHKNVRIEACETCRRYVKSIDLTLDARPLPEVDDLVSLAMDLWAIEEGWTRLEPGWAGIWQPSCWRSGSEGSFGAREDLPGGSHTRPTLQPRNRPSPRK